MRRRLRRLATALLALVLLGAIGVVVLPRVVPYPRRLLERRETVVVLGDRDGVPIRFYRDRDGHRHAPVRIERVSPYLRRAVIAVEDRRFRSHAGVDPVAVVRAIRSNVTSRRIVSGASTITMQLARLLEPRPRSFGAKCREAFRALQLEHVLDKNEILERYLDRVPMGRNLRGVEAASWFWFGKSAEHLDLPEAALLAGLPQSPSRLDPVRHPGLADDRRRHVLARMRVAGLISDREHDRAVGQKPVARPHPFPFVAPHFADIARSRARGSIATTTLDRGIQARATGTLRRRLRALDDVSAGAIVVIDNHDSAVRALVGGPGWSRAGLGRVNLATRPRSPGSALKPFLTALALQRGEILPDTILADVPGGVAGYEPGNFDETHRGLVTAREALRSSLNVPAIRLLRRVGVAPFLARLRRLGLDTLSGDAGDHGLALILGGGEVTLLDLTAAYATLAGGGRRCVPRVLEDEPVAAAEMVFAPGVTRQVAEMLAVRDGPRTGRGESLLAIKTGTSNGRRDAWALGFDPDWTVGVWLGNPGGRPATDLVGATAATPLLLDVFRALRAVRPARWFAPPAPGRDVVVCRHSKLRATARCPDPGLAAAAPGARRLRDCDLHRTVLVDAISGEIRCSRCLAGRPVRREAMLARDRTVRSYLVRTGAGDPGPAHAGNCPTRARPPRIHTPRRGETYPRRLPLRAETPVDWFVDGRPVGRGRSRTVPVGVGRHVVRAVAQDGSSTSVTIDVR